MAKDTTSSQGSYEFPATDWSKVQCSYVEPEVLEELCRLYWPPLYAFFRKKGFDEEQAKDFVQGFFTDKVLGQELLKKSTGISGKLRSFLVVSARNYAIDLLRKQKEGVSFDSEEHGGGIDDSAEKEFDRVWARELIGGVLKELEAESLRNKKEKHWSLFKKRVIDSEESSVEQLCAEAGIEDVSKAYNMVSNMKKRFRTIMRRTLRAYGLTEKEVDQEILELMQVVGE